MSDDVTKPSDLGELGEDLSEGERGDAGKIRTIVVDREACIGARSCAIVAEKVFIMDDQDLAYVGDDLDSTDDETIKLAAESCPVLAIHLYNKEGKKVFPE